MPSRHKLFIWAIPARQRQCTIKMWFEARLPATTTTTKSPGGKMPKIPLRLALRCRTSDPFFVRPSEIKRWWIYPKLYPELPAFSWIEDQKQEKFFLPLDPLCKNFYFALSNRRALVLKYLHTKYSVHRCFSLNAWLIVQITFFVHRFFCRAHPKLAIVIKAKELIEYLHLICHRRRQRQQQQHDPARPAEEHHHPANRESRGKSRALSHWNTPDKYCRNARCFHDGESVNHNTKRLSCRTISSVTWLRWTLDAPIPNWGKFVFPKSWD